VASDRSYAVKMKLSAYLKREKAKIKARVRRGLAWVFKRYPELKIDKDKLALNSPCNCVLGQARVHRLGEDACGMYGNELQDQGLNDADACRMGFTAPKKMINDVGRPGDRHLNEVLNYYEALTAEWKRQLPH
jgi:hypothetical protein